ncbi:MAG: hypothetical protein HC842_04225 [Cytophagales bacterium]|nr:hypothetical protein [Cytophagales bacterium]
MVDGHEPGTFAWSFLVDYDRKAPSPVALWAPDQVVVNGQSTLSQLQVILGGYDVYQKEHSLDSLFVQYDTRIASTGHH